MNNKPQIEYIGTYMNVSREFMIKTHNADDFMFDRLTYALKASLLTASKETGEITVHVERPSFWDWLFRRTKTITKPYIIRQLMKAEPVKDSLPVIEFDPQSTT